MMLQQYVDGTCLYIPSVKNQTTKSKQNLTTFKLMQKQRNEQITHEYQSGVSVAELAHRYYLSKQAIYKILKY